MCKCSLLWKQFQRKVSNNYFRNKFYKKRKALLSVNLQQIQLCNSRTRLPACFKIENIERTKKYFSHFSGNSSTVVNFFSIVFFFFCFVFPHVEVGNTVWRLDTYFPSVSTHKQYICTLLFPHNYNTFVSAHFWLYKYLFSNTLVSAHFCFHTLQVLEKSKSRSEMP